MPYIFGQLNDIKTADQICQRLRERGIEASYVKGQDGSLGLVVEHEHEVATAHDYFRVALGMPPRFEVPPEALAMAKVPTGHTTLILIAICVGVALLTWIGDADQVRALLMITSGREGQLSEVMSGQWWRLLTPAIVHFGFIHLLFNMMWLKSLGSIIEYTRGRTFFIALTISSALFSNLLQWWFKGPLFGGMSGVVYALLGFLWMAKEFNTEEEFSLPKQDVLMMIGWFVLCLTGLLGPIANFAHAGGLAIGMAVGIGAGIYKSKKLEPVKTLKFSSAALVVLVATWAAEVYLF